MNLDTFCSRIAFISSFSIKPKIGKNLAGFVLFLFDFFRLWIAWNDLVQCIWEWCARHVGWRCNRCQIAVCPAGFSCRDWDVCLKIASEACLYRWFEIIRLISILHLLFFKIYLFWYGSIQENRSCKYQIREYPSSFDWSWSVIDVCCFLSSRKTFLALDKNIN